MISCVFNFPLPETQEAIDSLVIECRHATQKAQADDPLPTGARRGDVA